MITLFIGNRHSGSEDPTYVRQKASLRATPYVRRLTNIDGALFFARLGSRSGRFIHEPNV
jgi:hypothetical protein